MKLLVTLAALMMVTGSVVAQRCGCNKPNVNKPRPAAPATVQRPAAATPRQCAQAKPCAQRPVAR